MVKIEAVMAKLSQFLVPRKHQVLKTLDPTFPIMRLSLDFPCLMTAHVCYKFTDRWNAPFDQQLPSNMFTTQSL